MNSKIFRTLFQFFLLVSTGIVLSFSTACKSADNVYVYEESDALTEAEKNAVIEHVRLFCVKSKLHLSPAERNFIRKSPPTVKIHYTGEKRGELLVRWDFPNYRSLIVKRSGYLLSEGKNDWNVRIMTDRATPTIPRSFYGAKGENISRLKPEEEAVLESWQGDPAPEKKQ